MQYSLLSVTGALSLAHLPFEQIEVTAVFKEQDREFGGGVETASKTDKIKVPLPLLVDIRSLLYALVNVFHPDWLIRSNFH